MKDTLYDGNTCGTYQFMYMYIVYDPVAITTALQRLKSDGRI
jgi:hypothetical protein